jgi:hypothetical protein
MTLRRFVEAFHVLKKQTNPGPDIGGIAKPAPDPPNQNDDIEIKFGYKLPYRRKEGPVDCILRRVRQLAEHMPLRKRKSSPANTWVFMIGNVEECIFIVDIDCTYKSLSQKKLHFYAQDLTKQTERKPRA